MSTSEVIFRLGSHSEIDNSMTGNQETYHIGQCPESMSLSGPPQKLGAKLTPDSPEKVAYICARFTYKVKSIKMSLYFSSSQLALISLAEFVSKLILI